MIITGVYNKTIFRNEDNGYTVFLFLTKDLNEYKDNTGMLVCCGYLPHYTEDIPLELVGEINSSNNDSYTFIVESSRLFANEKQLAINYLCSDVFFGIGPKTAEKILKVTGTDFTAFAEREDSISVLQEKIPELKDEKAAKFIKSIRNSALQKEIYNTIAPFGGKYSNAQKMYEKYGIDSIRSFKEDPYSVGYNSSLPFTVCDAFALSQHFHIYDSRRLKSLVYRIMTLNENRGHTYITLEQMSKVLSNICPQLAFQEIIPLTVLLPIINNLKGIRVVNTGKETKIFREKVWKEENNIASNIHRLSTKNHSIAFNPGDISLIEHAFNIKYAPEQKQAFNILKNTGVKILTGGPGTGKSTVINGLIYAYKRIYPDNKIVLTAPTGRAAQRITEITNMPACTLHRLLDVRPFGNIVTYKDLSNPIDADFIIVDEVSMADTELMSMLLGATKNNTLVLLCGDVDQLPSVGAGNVLADLINSECIDVYQLKQVFRQKGDSKIITMAHDIKLGRTAFKTGPDVEIIRLSSPDFDKTIIDCINKYYNKTDAFQMQVLCTSKKGAGGTKSLNELIQQHLISSECLLSYNNVSFKIGDKIMTLRNNYELGYLNGDIGTIKDITHNSVIVTINGEDITIKNSDLKDLTLAYASTVHKSQGAEHNVVVVVLPQSPFNMLQRNLLYTAVTRAKKKLIVISEGNALEAAVNNTRACVRYTDLCNKIIYANSTKCN